MCMPFSEAGNTVVNQTDKISAFRKLTFQMRMRQTINIKVNKKISLVISDQIRKPTDMLETDQRATLASVEGEGGS